MIPGFFTEAFQDDRLLWFLNRGTGVILLILMTTSVVLGVLSTVRSSSAIWPRFVTQQLHRNISLMAVGLLIAHAATAIIDSFVSIHPWDAIIPFVGSYHPKMLGLGTLATDIIILTALTALSRTSFRPRTWRAIHLTSYLGWGAGLVHGFGIGTDSHEVWSIAVSVLCVGAVAGSLAVRLGTLASERRMERRTRTADRAIPAGGRAPEDDRLQGSSQSRAGRRAAGRSETANWYDGDNRNDAGGRDGAGDRYGTPGRYDTNSQPTAATPYPARSPYDTGTQNTAGTPYPAGSLYDTGTQYGTGRQYDTNSRSDADRRNDESGRYDADSPRRRNRNRNAPADRSDPDTWSTPVDRSDPGTWNDPGRPSEADRPEEPRSRSEARGRNRGSGRRRSGGPNR